MRAILFTGGIFHDFASMSAAAAGILAAGGFKVEIVHSPAELVAALNRAPAELVVAQALRWRMLGAEKYEPFRAEWAYATGDDLIAAMGAHLALGGGVLSLHTGCICFDDWPGWRDILGGGWVWGGSFHAPGLEPVQVTPTARHAITNGVAPFAVTDEHYRKLALQPGSAVLAEGKTASGESHPVVWVRSGGAMSGRAATITTGHDLASLTEPSQARLIQQAALWAAGQIGDQAT